ncbi:MAG: hypothetical protein ACRDO7_07605 [Nocardioidaceae bacterium]
MLHRTRRATTRRGVALSASGALVAGVLAGAIVGAAGPASAVLAPVTHKFDTVCDVQVDDLAIPNQEIRARLATKAEFPLVPGTPQPAQDVRVTLIMPKTLQRAAKVLNVTHTRRDTRPIPRSTSRSRCRPPSAAR